MTPEDLDRVFGHDRLQMATGDHVEVFREAAVTGEPRRYTKRFLVSPTGDLRPWTGRERKILERLGAHAQAPVAKLVPGGAGADGAAPVMQTYDAGATIDQWATMVPLRRGNAMLRNVFEDCAYWWALARQCLLALDELHALGFVHLELKADNLCIPWTRAGADPPVPGQPLAPRFNGLALIDVAFSLLPGVELAGPLPLARHPSYEYQSPRLLEALDAGRRGDLAPTLALDWRCDFFSLAALLWRYLPELDLTPGSAWTGQRPRQAMDFVRSLLEVHDAAALPEQRPHRELIALTTLRLREPRLAASFQGICTFDPERRSFAGTEATPRTRLFRPAVIDEDAARRAAPAAPAEAATIVRPQRRRAYRAAVVPALGAAALGSLVAAALWLLEPAPGEYDLARAPEVDRAASASAAPPSDDRRSAGVVSPAPVTADSPATVAASSPDPAAAVSPATVAAVSPAPVAAQSPATVAVASPPGVAGPSSAPVAGASAPPAVVATAAPPAGDKPSTDPAETPAPKAPPTASTPSGGSTADAASGNGNEFAAVASELMRSRIPRRARSAERLLAPVLAGAGAKQKLRSPGEIRRAARAARASAAPPNWDVEVHSSQARALNEAARLAYGARSIPDAIELQTRAFGANALDPEVVGNLAFFRLQDRPPQAEASRQLALHALTLKDGRFPGGRIEDWTTLAIANALTGREADARNTWFVTLALAGDLKRHCDAAARTPVIYGEELRPSVQTMLQRARSSPGYAKCASEPARKASDRRRAGSARGGGVRKP